MLCLLHVMLRGLWGSRIYISILWLKPRGRGCNFDDKGSVFGVKYSNKHIINSIFKGNIKMTYKQLKELENDQDLHEITTEQQELEALLKEYNLLDGGLENDLIN